MKNCQPGIVIIGLIAMTSAVCAQEKLPVLKVGSETYSNVTITEVSATDVYFTFGKAMGNAKLKNLDPEMQKHFHYNAAEASTAEQEQRAGAAQYNLRFKGATRRIPGAPEPQYERNEAGIKAEMEDTISRVQEIVNQPVQPVSAPERGKSLGTFPYWFHQGAEKPDFNTVDIRATQDVSHYSKFDYVNSAENPSVLFNGDELEFNSMTKYFYTDRSIPKKKLTQEEMIEINRLYRIIGRDEQDLAKLQNH